MKIIAFMSLIFMVGCSTIVLDNEYNQECHMEGMKRICELKPNPFNRDGRDVR